MVKYIERYCEEAGDSRGGEQFIFRMSLRETLLALDGAAYVNDDGEQRRLRLLPPLGKEDIDRVSPLMPEEIRQVLAISRGIEGAEHVNEGIVDLSGLFLQSQVLDEFSPDGQIIASDMCGNSWIVDPPTGWVFYLCHDAPVVVYQFPTLEGFLAELRRTPEESLLGRPLQEWVDRIWAQNPGVLPWAQALEKDPALVSFATKLGPQWEIMDLRRPQPGDGFSWGRFGPDTEIQRHPKEYLVGIRRGSRHSGAGCGVIEGEKWPRSSKVPCCPTPFPCLRHSPRQSPGPVRFQPMPDSP